MSRKREKISQEGKKEAVGVIPTYVFRGERKKRKEGKDPRTSLPAVSNGLRKEDNIGGRRGRP